MGLRAGKWDQESLDCGLGLQVMGSGSEVYFTGLAHFPAAVLNSRSY